MSKSDISFLSGCVLFGAAGALIGFGSHGTLRAAAGGGGIGLLVLPAILLFFGGGK